MKEVIITIDEREITGRIFSESGYAALARAKGGLAEHFTDMVQATDDDRSVIKSFITDSINEAAGVISRYMTPCTVGHIGSGCDADGTICIHFTMPHNSPTGIISTLKEYITGFAVARSLQQWMLTVKPDEAGIHLTKAQSILQCMREQFSVRSRPVKEEADDDNIIEL